MKASVLWAAVLVASVAGPAFCVDKAALEQHLREALNLDTRTPISAGDPQPSEVGNLLQVPITIGQSKATIFLTPDQSRYIWGQVMNLSVDPDKARAEQIHLDGAPSQGDVNAPITIVE